MALVSVTAFTPAMGHSQGANRPAAIQCPPRLEDDLTDDNPVRIIAVCVDALELAALGLRHAGAAATGRPS